MGSGNSKGVADRNSILVRCPLRIWTAYESFGFNSVELRPQNLSYENIIDRSV